MLTATRRVLDIHGCCSEPGTILFEADDEGGSYTVLSVDESAWEDMGKPQQVTVTIEPGDGLNQ